MIDSAQANRNRIHALEVLQATRSLFSYYGWTKGREARDAEGEEVRVWAREAVCFCLTGMIRRACWELHANTHVLAFDDACAAMLEHLSPERQGGGPRASGILQIWNDAAHRELPQVLDLLDRTIAGLQS